MQLGSFSADNVDDWIAYIGDAYVRYIYAKAIYIRDAYIGGTCVGGACIRDACVGITNTIKHSEIHLQLFWISEVRILYIGW